MTNLALDQSALGLALNAAFVNSYVSKLGGTPTLMLTVSLDKRSDWVNGILENGRYAHFSIDQDGAIENFSGTLPKFRKCKAADDAAVATKLNAWIAKVSA
jgi:hypothetical protein